MCALDLKIGEVGHVKWRRAWHSGGVRTEIIDQTDSTQDDLLDLVAQDAQQWPHLSALMARKQGAGRGRLGRVWDTGDVSALTVSYVVRLSAPTQQWATIALRAGVGVVRALAQHGVKAMVKWPNDVVIPREHEVSGWEGIAKAGGILGSMTKDSLGRPTCVLGIGINLKGQVGVAHGASLDLDRAPEDLVEDIRVQLGQILPEHAQTLEPVNELMVEYCHTLGKSVEVTYPYETPPRVVAGRATRVDGDGALVIETPQGEERIINGDVAHTRLQVGLG